MRPIMMRLILPTLVVWAAVVLLSFTAQALPAWTSDIDISVGPAMNTMSVTAAMLEANSGSTVENADGSITFMNGTMMMAGMWQWSWMNLTLDPDPVVSMVGGFANISGSSQNFILSVIAPVSPLVVPSSLIGGSTNLTYGDANGDGLGGLTNSALGGAGYSGTIDGANVLDLLTSFSLTPAFPGDTTQSASAAVGLGGASGPPLPGPAALTSIGIVHRFNLSSLDQVTYNSFFRVDAVPEPGTAVMLGLGLAGLGLARRRRA